jgi:hypothetical protein
MGLLDTNYAASDIKKHVDGLSKQYSGEDLHKRIYSDARSRGVTSGQLENAMGWEAGTTKSWTEANGRQALDGNFGDTKSPYSTLSNDFTSGEISSRINDLGAGTGSALDHENRVYRDALKTGTTEKQLEDSMGWATGTVRDWTTNNGLDPLNADNKHLTTGGDAATGWQTAPSKAVSREVNPLDTVQGQLDGLLNKENPLMQRAYYKGKDYANGRGLLESSVGAEAAQAAMLDAALPIAQNDAATNYDQGKTNQAYDNQFNLNDRQFLQATEQTAEQNALQRQHEIDAQNQAGATDREIEATKQDAGLYAQFLKGVSDINAGNMGQGEKDAAVQSLWTQYTAGSQIANSLRYINVNADGTVTRTEPTNTTVDTGQPAVAADNSNTTALIFGQGVYTPGVTRDSNGQIVDKSGAAKPQGNFTLSNAGEWQAIEAPRDTR